MEDSKEVITFVIENMRRALMTIADVKFSDTNRNMAITMRAIARGVLKECADALKGVSEKDGGIPVRGEEATQ